LDNVSIDWSTVSVPTSLPGDLNGDNVVDFGDLTPFVTALTDTANYQAMYPALDRVARCDTSGDGQCSFADIVPFVGLLNGSSPFANTAAIPEPSSLVLLGVAFAAHCARLLNWSITRHS
jgi:hypothetical protein